MQFLLIILEVIAASIVYGILHDQVTARLCVEYFTIGHPPIFPTSDPTLLAFGWGVIATWWAGAAMGILIAAAARFGPQPRINAKEVLRPLTFLMILMFVLAATTGTVAHVVASRGGLELPWWLAERIPVEKQVWFLTDLWAHRASYLGGFVGSLILAIFLVSRRLQRRLQSHQNALASESIR